MIVIESGVPVPRRSGARTEIADALKNLPVNHSFVIPSGHRQSAVNYAKRFDIKIATRFFVDQETGVEDKSRVRVWKLTEYVASVPSDLPPSDVDAVADEPAPAPEVETCDFH